MIYDIHTELIKHVLFSDFLSNFEQLFAQNSSPVVLSCCLFDQSQQSPMIIKYQNCLFFLSVINHSVVCPSVNVGS